MRDNPQVRIEFSAHEVKDLPEILKMNQADFILIDYLPQMSGVETQVIGEEEYVVIESREHKNVPNIFLDHGPHDNATEEYFKFQKKSLKLKRGFMGDVYGILDGVALGLGKAVMSKHLVDGDKRFRIVPGGKPYLRPIVLANYRQSYYPQLYKEILNIFAKKKH